MICDCCSKDKPDVIERIDPFTLEIYNKKELVIMCDECIQIRADDI